MLKGSVAGTAGDDNLSRDRNKMKAPKRMQLWQVSGLKDDQNSMAKTLQTMIALIQQHNGSTLDC